MRALRYYGPGDVRLDEIPEPEAGVKQIKIKVAWTGICGSDLHAYHARLPNTPSATEPQPITGETLPIVLGHEFSGTIVDVGKGVDEHKFHVGQNVVIEPLLSCRKPTCLFCAEGTRNLCPHASFHGLAGWGGGLAEYISVAEDQVYPLPNGVPLDVGALMEPLAVAWHAAKRSNMKAGDNVLVLGAGPIGLLVLKVAKVFGAAWVGVSEPAFQRRELARVHGADVMYDPTAQDTDVPALVRAYTGGRGADVVFDCSGNQRTLDTACQAVRPRGNIVNVAVWDRRPLLDIDAITYREISLTGILAYDRVHAEMLEAVAQGKFKNLETLITRRIPLDNFVDHGINALLHEKDKHVKILVRPGPSLPDQSLAIDAAS